ncbi:(E3-independent) E2 ubiquitin-conjugating enzyme [Ranunculus cassubicifolius]
MDLLRAVIVGAAGTPYHDGLFFFDVLFPSNYPNMPPQVHYHSGGLRLNPNLYGCGKVCLSLLNTWYGMKEEQWTPKKSTMLQVLLSIQALVLNAKPYFNEPGFSATEGSAEGEKSSRAYNETTYILSCRSMLFTLKRPPKHFEEYVVGHFLDRAHAILVACKAYMEGAQVGCLAEGGVQDVDEGDRSCSQHFKAQVRTVTKNLVAAFVKNGSRNCEQFLPKKRNNRDSSTSSSNARPKPYADRYKSSSW